jgi:hypothetical protein
MRIAIVSDIHGNRTAFETVLASRVPVFRCRKPEPSLSVNISKAKCADIQDQGPC